MEESHIKISIFRATNSSYEAVAFANADSLKAPFRPLPDLGNIGNSKEEQNIFVKNIF